jgi:hypothetical protein
MRKFTLLFLWLIFLFVLLELAGLAFFTFYDIKPISGYGYPEGIYAEHAELGYLYQPGFSGVFKGSAYQHIPIDINEHGFRDAPFAARSPGRPRVIVTGDSVVFGPGVRKQDRFTECLQDSGMGFPGSVEVLNLGVNSWTFEHYATLADLNYLELDPDFVLVGITLNDFARMENARPAKRIDRHKTGFPKPVWFGRLQERLARTYAARFLNELDTRYTYARMNSDELEEYHTKWMRTIVSSWADAENVSYFTSQLRRFRDSMSKRETKYAFVLFPELNDVLDPQDFGQPRQTVRTILEDNDLQYCDPYDVFRAAADPASLFLPHDDVHYTAAGHALLCSALSECIANNRIPPATAASRQ